MWKHLQTLAQVGLCLSLAACGSKPPVVELPPPPTVVQLSLKADPNINQDSRGRPTSVVVRYYLLSHPAAFESADFFSLFDGDEKTLAGTSALREEITLKPGDTVTTTLRPGAEAKALGVFVAYRDPNKSLWRAVTPIRRNTVNVLQARIGRDAVSIAPLP